MRVLIGCERSGRVRDEFLALGHDAWSCDLASCWNYGPHLKCDVRELLCEGWDMAIFFPDCTYLAGSGLHWNKRRPWRAERTEKALEFVATLLSAPIEKIALENPVGCISTRIRRPDQIVHPWQFGENASKATCLWLKNLPHLQPTEILPGGRLARRANQTASGQNRLGPSPTRAMDRATTYRGIARAMAQQWGSVVSPKFSTVDFA